MRKIHQYMLVGALLAGVAIPGIWQSCQPEQKYRTKVEDIEVNKYCSDLQGFCTVSYIVHFEGLDRAVIFSSHEWDDTVKEGDTVDIIVRENYPLPGGNKYDGVSIDDGK